MEQRQFLTRLAVKYQRSVNDSLTGSYDHAWESDDPRKLRMHLQKTNDDFSMRMAERGHTRIFRLIDDAVDKDFARSRGDEESIYEWIDESTASRAGQSCLELSIPPYSRTCFASSPSRGAT